MVTMLWDLPSNKNIAISFLQSKELLHDKNKSDGGYEMKLHFGKEYFGSLINV